MKLRILIVEDDRLNAKFLEFSLRRRAHWDVELSEDVQRILERARSGEIDLVILDVSLSNSRYQGRSLDGLEICKLLKQDACSGRLPVLLATAHAMKGDRERLLQASGADECIHKPIADPDELIGVVRRLVENARANGRRA